MHTRGSAWTLRARLIDATLHEHWHALVLHEHCVRTACDVPLHVQDVLHVLLPAFLQRTAAAALQAGGRDDDSPVALPAGRCAARKGAEAEEAAAPAGRAGARPRLAPDASGVAVEAGSVRACVD